MNTELATFGAGCFWCVEAIFSALNGVLEVVPGYCGGTLPSPSYEEVYTDKTGHAEVCQIKFDPNIISFSGLLEVFWKIHDPTTLNQQGEDIGTRYRSVIFYHTDEQKHIAECLKQKLEEKRIWENTLVTNIEPFIHFYKAEAYHLDYYRNNPQNEYCSLVITPKIEKFKKVFSDFLK
jgi:peptide-methionine (S)-S-oxide reductase